MSNVHALDIPEASFDDDAWDDLLNFIEERGVKAKRQVRPKELIGHYQSWRGA